MQIAIISGLRSLRLVHLRNRSTLFSGRKLRSFFRFVSRPAWRAGLYQPGIVSVPIYASDEGGQGLLSGRKLLNVSRYSNHAVVTGGYFNSDEERDSEAAGSCAEGNVGRVSRGFYVLESPCRAAGK